MAVSPGFADFVVEQLDGCGPVVTRRMFGGVGIYSGDVFFAIIDNDILYLKTDDSNRADFEAAGSGPFRPNGEAGETMMYYSVPVSVLEDADELAAWGRKAIAVAVAAKGRKRPGKGIIEGLRKAPASRPATAVDAELRGVRAARRKGGRRSGR